MKLEVISSLTDEVERVIEFTPSEQAMPGYVEFVEGQYEGTIWYTKRVGDNATL